MQRLRKTDIGLASVFCIPIPHRVGNAAGGLASTVFCHAKAQDDWQRKWGGYAL